MKIAIILCGIPNAGKSTWTRKYKNSTSKLVISVSRDTIRENKNWFNQPYVYTNSNEVQVTKLFNRELKLVVDAGVDAIIDNTNCKESYIDPLIDYFEENGYNVYVKFLPISTFKAKKRELWRRIKINRKVSFKVIDQMKKNYDSLNKKKYKLINYDYNFVSIH